MLGCKDVRNHQPRGGSIWGHIMRSCRGKVISKETRKALLCSAPHSQACFLPPSDALPHFWSVPHSLMLSPRMQVPRHDRVPFLSGLQASDVTRGLPCWWDSKWLPPLPQGPGLASSREDMPSWSALGVTSALR